MATNKPFLIMQLRPEDETADNEFAAILRHGGLEEGEVERLRIEVAGIPDLDIERFAAIIVGGSPFDISTPEDDKSPIQKKIEADFRRLFDVVVERDLPFLGCCSGNGLLGHYLGASISRRYGEPVGGLDMTLTEDGLRDPLLSGFPPVIRVLAGHKEACDTVPPGAVLLGSTETCPVQMFRVGRHVYATQFHPEGDFDGFSLRVNIYRNHGYFDPADADALIERLNGEETPHAQAFLRRFVERYRN